MVSRTFLAIVQNQPPEPGPVLNKVESKKSASAQFPERRNVAIQNSATVAVHAVSSHFVSIYIPLAYLRFEYQLH